MSARWEEALDAQLDIFRYCETELGRYIHSNWQPLTGDGARSSDRLVKDGDPISAFIDGPGSTVYEKLADRLPVMAFNADPIYVDPEMMTVWQAAEPSFQPEVIRAEDFITPAGFILLPRPYAMPDKHGKTITFRGVLWSPINVEWRDPEGKRWDDAPTGGVILTLWSWLQDRDDYYLADLARQTNWSLLHVMAMPFQVSVKHEDVETPGAIVRPVQCLLRLLSQTVAAPVQERASKPFRRRWERANWPEKRVTVVRLRRPAGPEHDVEHRTVDWSHRWLVGGHWRNQWYATLGVHRQIWISPFVKGPADKPLEVNKLRAFEWVR